MLVVRAFQVESAAGGQLRYQLLVMQNGKPSAPFEGRYEMTMSGELNGEPWSAGLLGGAKPLQVKQYARVEGRIAPPEGAVVKTVQVRVLNGSGAVMATQMAKL